MFSIHFTDIYEQLKFNLYQDDAVTGKYVVTSMTHFLVKVKFMPLCTVAS